MSYQAFFYSFGGNPPVNAASLITTIGYTSLWVGFAFTGVATAIFGFLSYVRNVKPEARLVYYLVTLINFITALAYLLMALGGTDIQGHNVGSVLAVYNTAAGGYTANAIDPMGPYNATPTNTRAFLWVRYAAWIFVAPLTMVILGLLGGAHWGELVWTAGWAMLGVRDERAGTRTLARTPTRVCQLQHRTPASRLTPSWSA
jgi:bacteriorhodopsin